MRNYRSKGIVLILKQLQEANRMAIIWTEDHGKKAYLVKGANKILSRKSATLDQLNLIGFGAYRSRSEYDLLTETELINDFQYLKKASSGLSFSMYLLELLDRFLPGEQPAYELFHWVCALLDFVKDHPDDLDKYLILVQQKVLSEFGYAPLLDSCSYCFRELKPGEDRIVSSGAEAGFICYRHFDSISTNSLLISDTIVKVMKFLNSADLDAIANLNLDATTAAKIFKIQHIWLESVSDKALRSQELLKIWRNPEK